MKKYLLFAMCIILCQTDFYRRCFFVSASAAAGAVAIAVPEMIPIAAAAISLAAANGYITEISKQKYLAKLYAMAKTITNDNLTGYSTVPYFKMLLAYQKSFNNIMYSSQRKAIDDKGSNLISESQTILIANAKGDKQALENSDLPVPLKDIFKTVLTDSEKKISGSGSSFPTTVNPNVTTEGLIPPKVEIPKEALLPTHDEMLKKGCHDNPNLQNIKAVLNSVPGFGDVNDNSKKLIHQSLKAESSAGKTVSQAVSSTAESNKVAIGATINSLSPDHPAMQALEVNRQRLIKVIRTPEGIINRIDPMLFIKALPILNKNLKNGKFQLIQDADSRRLVYTEETAVYVLSPKLDRNKFVLSSPFYVNHNLVKQSVNKKSHDPAVAVTNENNKHGQEYSHDLKEFYTGRNKTTPLPEKFVTDAIEFPYHVQHMYHHRPFTTYMKNLAPMGLDINTLRKKTVVDVGCGLSNFIDFINAEAGANGTGYDPIFHRAYHKPLQELIAEDPAKNMQFVGDLENYQRYPLQLVNRKAGSFSNLPITDSSVDVLVTSNVTIYFDTPVIARCVEETIRVLKPGGTGYFLEETKHGNLARTLDRLGIPYEIVEDKDRGGGLMITKPQDYGAPL